MKLKFVRGVWVKEVRKEMFRSKCRVMSFSENMLCAVLTRVKRTRNLVMSPIIRPREICRVPRTSKAGMRYVVRAMLSTLATAKRTSETISGSSGLHSNLANTRNESHKQSRLVCDTHDQLPALHTTTASLNLLRANFVCPP